MAGSRCVGGEEATKIMWVGHGAEGERSEIRGWEGRQCQEEEFAYGVCVWLDGI